MANLFFNAVTGKIDTGTALKTLFQLVAPANQRLLVHQLEISFEGISTTDSPILVEILRQSTAGTMSSLTLVKQNNSDDETIQATAQHTATAEPTAGDVLVSMLIHPQSRHVFFFQNKPLVVKGGGRLGLRVTAGTSQCNAVVAAYCEE